MNPKTLRRTLFLDRFRRPVVVAWYILIALGGIVASALQEWAARHPKLARWLWLDMVLAGLYLRWAEPVFQRMEDMPPEDEFIPEKGNMS